MLPKSRIVASLLLGLGACLVAAGLVAPHFLNFSPRLPLGAAETTWTFHDEDASARHLSAEGASPYHGPVTYQLHMDVQDPSDKDTATIKVGETTALGTAEQLRDVNNLVSAQVWSYQMDRLTGEATSQAQLNYQLASPAAKVDVDGYWLKFPTDAEQTNYQVFDPYLRSASEAVFVEETTVEGRTVYRYHQDIAPTNVATKFAGPFNTTQVAKQSTPAGDAAPTGEAPEGEAPQPAEALAPEMEQGYLFHSGSRDYYVDQQTGMLVGMDVNIDDYYGTRTGERREDAFVFNASTSDEDRAAFVKQAADLPEESVGRTITWVLIGVGALLSILGLLGVFGAFGRRRS